MAALIGLDDTDSRQEGMCSTYLGTQIAEQLAAAGITVTRHVLFRCNPAAPHKTRGNAAIGLHTDGQPDRVFKIAQAAIDDLAVLSDPDTHPGLVVAPHDPASIPDAVAAFAADTVRSLVTVDRALDLATQQGYQHTGWKTGRGVIGAMAAIGAWAANTDWTYERITYREPDRWGTTRTVDRSSVFAAANEWYPTIWDTVDRTADTVVCVPHTPGPVLYGIRGDDPTAVEQASAAIDSEPVDSATTFVTNQGTDAHLQSVPLQHATDGMGVCADGTVTTTPETREGGHVFFELSNGTATRQCVAFEPTKRFRDRVRALRVGDELTVCGEVDSGTIKLEKFAVRSLTRQTQTVPTCPSCGRSMESAGAEQGYRCRSCGTTAAGKTTVSLDRSLANGWYEVPPVARRHIAKPLVRGGFDAPTHPER